MRGTVRAGLCRGAGLMVHTLLAGGSGGIVSLSKLLSSLLQKNQKYIFEPEHKYSCKHFLSTYFVLCIVLCTFINRNTVRTGLTWDMNWNVFRCQVDNEITDLPQHEKRSNPSITKQTHLNLIKQGETKEMIAFSYMRGIWRMMGSTMFSKGSRSYWLLWGSVIGKKQFPHGRKKAHIINILWIGFQSFSFNYNKFSC